MANFYEEFFKTEGIEEQNAMYSQLLQKLGLTPYTEEEMIKIIESEADGGDLHRVEQYLQASQLINSLKSNDSRRVAAKVASSWSDCHHILYIRAVVEMMRKNKYDDRIEAVIGDVSGSLKLGEYIVRDAYRIARAENIKFKGEVSLKNSVCAEEEFDAK